MGKQECNDHAGGQKINVQIYLTKTKAACRKVIYVKFRLRFLYT